MVFFLLSSPITVGRRGQHDDETLDNAPLGRPRNDGMERQSVISADDREIDAPRDPIVDSCGLLGSSLPASVMFTLLASSARSCPAVGGARGSTTGQLLGRRALGGARANGTCFSYLGASGWVSTAPRSSAFAIANDVRIALLVIAAEAKTFASLSTV